MYCKQLCMSQLVIIVCDKLEWERKMEEQGIHVWYEGSNVVLKLVSLCGWHEGSNIYKRLVQLVMRFIWQAKVMWMRHNMLLHSLKLGWLAIWDKYWCQGKQAREKWMRYELVHMLSQIGKLAYEIKWWIYFVKEDFMHDTNQYEVQNEWLG